MKLSSFPLNALFDIEGQKRVSIKDLQDGETIVIAGGIENNGQVGKYDTPGKYKNKITVTRINGTAFYHNYIFSTTESVFVLSPKKELSEEQALFVTTVISKIFNNKYSYTNKLNTSRLSKEKIFIPIIKK